MPSRTEGAPSFAHSAKGGIPRTRPSRDSRAAQREGHDFSRASSCARPAPNPPHAPPWKSGASAPRQAIKKSPGFSPGGSSRRNNPRHEPKNLVIPNRAESPREPALSEAEGNLRVADAVTDRGYPILR